MALGSFQSLWLGSVHSLDNHSQTLKAVLGSCSCGNIKKLGRCKPMVFLQHSLTFWHMNKHASPFSCLISDFVSET